MLQDRSLCTVSMVIEIKIVIGCFKLQLWMWLVDFKLQFECDWLIYTTTFNVIGSLNCPKTNFFKPITIEEIVIFMIMYKKKKPIWPRSLSLLRIVNLTSNPVC